MTAIAPAADGADHGEGQPYTAQVTENQRVLIAEDDSRLASMLDTLLGSEGFDVEVVMPRAQPQLSGPPQVATEQYRRNWDETFGEELD